MLERSASTSHQQIRSAAASCNQHAKLAVRMFKQHVDVLSTDLKQSAGVHIKPFARTPF